MGIDSVRYGRPRSCFEMYFEDPARNVGSPVASASPRTPMHVSIIDFGSHFARVSMAWIYGGITRYPGQRGDSARDLQIMWWQGHENASL